ncbi:MAG: DUF192 domain-containing protein [Methanobrevibacter sp.]|jgi:uncharacterized membrane protein (UPF0127 family)|nr:DUF192 domain-containing protein [Candidatus Methanovirga australis]
MKILFNKTKNKKISEVEIANSYLKRLKGLMFKKNITKGLILNIPKSRYSKRSSIHMFFMRISLDILFINEENKVYEMVALKPWKTYSPKKPAKYVVELKKDTINTKNIEVNDEISIKTLHEKYQIKE